MRLAVLMTCHNRREKTLACLRAFQRAAEAFAAAHFTIFLTDDGSTDGTADAVRGLSLDVRILNGPGDLYWNRGMVRAWEAAAESGVSFDGYVLLNDDTLLDPDAISRILDTSKQLNHQAIVVGPARDPDSGQLTYGGIRRKSKWHPGRTERVPLSDVTQEADTFNANCVLVPRSTFEVVGMLDPIFRHGIGDYDYGLRAKEAGIAVVVTSGTVGTCPRNNPSGTWRDSRVPLPKRLVLLESPKGLPRREWEEYLRRHGAPAPALLACLPKLTVIGSSISHRARSK